MHLPSASHLIFADDGNIVLGLTGNRADPTADAGIEIDRHSPRVSVVGDLRIKRLLLLWRRLRRFRGSARFFSKIGERSDAHQFAAFHIPMMLGRDEIV